MSSQPHRSPERSSYTVVAELIALDAWHMTVRELPATWTVAFAPDDLERRARERIALDLGCHPDDFDVRMVHAVPPSH